jgi:hypothetical protein
LIAFIRIKNLKSKHFDLFKQIAGLRRASFCGADADARLIRKNSKIISLDQWLASFITRHSRHAVIVSAAGNRPA